MIEWLNENPLIVFGFLVFVIFVLMFAFVKVKKKKPAKKEASKVEKKEEASAPEEGSAETETTEEPPIKIRAKWAKTRPQIEQIYKRSVAAKAEAEQKNEVDEFEGKEAQFVKSTGKVSKFIGFQEVQKKDEELIEKAVQEMEEQQKQECAICEPKTVHFDRTRRLSKMIRDDSFDDMLESHISGHYLNIDEKRHLRISEDFSEKLFERAMKTLSNSDVKILVDTEDSEDKPFEKMRGDKDFMKQWLADRKRENMAAFISAVDGEAKEELSAEEIEAIENDINLNPKNVIVVDSIVNRKGKRKRT